MGNKTILGAIVVTLGIFFYFGFVKEPATSVNEGLIVREQEDRISAESLGREIIKILGQIEDIKLNTDIFDSEGYKRLNNLNQEIPIQDPGKDSLFDPIDRSFFNEIILEQRGAETTIEAKEVLTDGEVEDNS